MADDGRDAMAITRFSFSGPFIYGLQRAMPCLARLGAERTGPCCEMKRNVPRFTPRSEGSSGFDALLRRLLFPKTKSSENFCFYLEFYESKNYLNDRT
jgi:hypothetical protein